MPFIWRFSNFVADKILTTMDEEKPKKKRKRKSAEGDGGHKENWKNVYATVEDIQLFLSERIPMMRSLNTIPLMTHLTNLTQFSKTPRVPRTHGTREKSLK